MKIRKSRVKLSVLAVILVAVVGAIAYTPKFVHLTKQILEVHPGSGKIAIVEEKFPENFSGCIEKDKAREMALDILLNDDEARKTLSKLIESYGDLIVEYGNSQGIAEAKNGELKICTGEFVIYPKDLFSRNITVSTNVDFVNRKLYLVPVLCDKVSGNLCIRYIDFELRKPTDEEREFAEEVLKEKGYKWYRISIGVKQLYTLLNGTIVPSSVMYWVILEPETSKGIYRATILNFDSDRVEDTHAKDVFVISAIPE